MRQILLIIICWFSRNQLSALHHQKIAKFNQFRQCQLSLMETIPTWRVPVEPILSAISHCAFLPLAGLGISVGQNLAWNYDSWDQAIQTWYDEVKDFHYGYDSGWGVLHFTQVSQPFHKDKIKVNGSLHPGHLPYYSRWFRWVSVRKNWVTSFFH